MSTIVLTRSVSPSITGEKTLSIAARLWFVIAVAGQWMFAYYIAALYGGSALRGDWTAWHKRMANGHGPATLGNVAMAIHLSLAVIILFGGPLQLIPQLRRLAPSPVGSAPVHGGERRLVLPRRNDVVARHQPRTRGFRPKDVLPDRS